MAGALEATLARLPHSKAVAGACVLDLSTGEIVFGHGRDVPMVPASTEKLFIMSAALDRLGEDFAFETSFGVYDADVVVIGGGDPGFGDPRLCQARGETVTAVFETWAGWLKKRAESGGVRKIIIDDSIFDDERIHPSWEPADLSKWYAAPVGGVNLNDNCVDITVTPAGRLGDLVDWSVVPPNGAVVLENRCKTVKSGGRPLLHHEAGTLDYRVTGTCSKRWTFAPVAFAKPALLFASSLQTVLERAGVPVQMPPVRARVRNSEGKLHAGIEILAVYRTPLADVLHRIGKNSQNLFAECLLKRLGYEYERRAGVDRPVGSWASGAQAVRAALGGAGVDLSGWVLSDGSGLSRSNRCTARQLADVLAWMQRGAHAEAFREALATPGEGSLRRDLADLADRVHAKTGTMRGVRALAGYVRARSGRTYAFAIMFNGYPGSSSPYKAIQHRFLTVLVDRG